MSDVAIEELCTLGVPVIDDIGSGVLAQGLSVLADEPPIARSLEAGAAAVCFSGDKLLGGPQAGIIVGAGEAVAQCRRHPLARALRPGRLTIAALAATLEIYRDPDRALSRVTTSSRRSMSWAGHVLRSRSSTSRALPPAFSTASSS